MNGKDDRMRLSKRQMAQAAVLGGGLFAQNTFFKQDAGATTTQASPLPPACALLQARSSSRLRKIQILERAAPDEGRAPSSVRFPDRKHPISQVGGWGCVCVGTRLLLRRRSFLSMPAPRHAGSARLQGSGLVSAHFVAAPGSAPGPQSPRRPVREGRI